MKPIGLTLKNIKTNPYTGRTNGELMIAHLCLGCGRISYNRIAGDDNSYAIINLLENPIKIDKKFIIRSTNRGIILLTHKDRPMVLTTLYGYDYRKCLR